MEQNNGNSENMTINRVILLCCGKFNPPTNMHLRMFERARDHLHSLKTYAVVGGIIVPTNNLSNSNDLAHNKTRCDLMEQSLESHDWVRLSKWHVSQSNWKTLKDTVLYHQNILDSFINNDIDDNNINNKDTDWIPPSIKNKTDNKPVKIKLLGSSDLLESFSEPDFWPEEDQEKLKMIRYVSDHLSILEEFGLVIVEHVGRDLGKLVYESDILYKYLHKIHLITEWIPYDASCARIRRALQRGESVKYFVPQKVINTINEQQFFGVHNWSSKNKAIADPSVKMDKLVGRVLLMSCGSYNPPTHMHLRMFERARDHLHKLGTHVVVGGLISPVHDDYGKKDLASSKDRCEMLRLALGDSDWIRLSTWETRQKGWTRTRASLEHHQRCIDSWINQDDANSNNAPQQNKQSEQDDDLDWIPKEVRNNEPDETQEVQIKLLCGGDLLESFSKPGLWDEADIAEIVGRYGLIVITREGSNPYKFIYDSDVLSKHLHNIQIVTEWIPNEVSSTRIRRALKRGESVKYLLQDPVIDYIYSNKLYDAHKPSTIKLELSSNYSSTDCLDADEATYGPNNDNDDGDDDDDDNAFLTTPSPSDVTMQEQTSSSNTTRAIAAAAAPTLDCAEKNLQNASCSKSLSSTDADTELAREKFFRSLVNDSLNFVESSTATSLLLLQQTSHDALNQLDQAGSYNSSQLELPSSARARNELLAFEDTTMTTTTTESELATLCGDNTYSDDREDDDDDDDALSITYEESSDDINELSVKTSKDQDKVPEELAAAAASGSGISSNIKGDDDPNVNSSILPPQTVPSFEPLDDSDSQTAKFETNLEIDGKYLKSLVSSKKSAKKIDDEESPKSESKEIKGIENKPQQQQQPVDESKKWSEKLFDEDLSYIKRLRLIINKPIDAQVVQQRQLQGSLDSINLKNENTLIMRRATIESMSKKSKSFESIKRNPQPLPIDENDDDAATANAAAPSTARFKSDSTSQLITLPDLDTQTEDFCTCCLAADDLQQQQQLQASSTELFYTMRSNLSSPDSTECDICSSCNLRDSIEALNNKSSDLQAVAQSLSENTELCEICGEPATSADEILTDEQPTSLGYAAVDRHSGLVGLPKAKSVMEISRGFYRMSTFDEDRFGVDSVGALRDCKLRASLDVCNKPEPLYVNVIPRHQLIEHHRSSRLRSEQPNYEQTAFRCMSREEQQQQQQQLPMSRSVSIGGHRRLSRRGSYPKKNNVVDRQQEKRRFSSVDNLQNRTSFRTSGEKFSRSRDNKFMTSADSIKPRVSRSRSLRRSADNVGRFCSSGDNLDSLEETADTDENGATTTTTTTTDGEKCTRLKIRDSDMIKMILTKHGIKIISQKETVL